VTIRSLPLVSRQRKRRVDGQDIDCDDEAKRVLPEQTDITEHATKESKIHSRPWALPPHPKCTDLAKSENVDPSRIQRTNRLAGLIHEYRLVA
jgi:hypothetical protein